jgi:hypothetical protein
VLWLVQTLACWRAHLVSAQRGYLSHSLMGAARIVGGLWDGQMVSRTFVCLLVLTWFARAAARLLVSSCASIQHTACSTHSTPHASHNTPYAAHSARRMHHSMVHTVCRMQHTHSTPHASHSIQHVGTPRSEVSPWAGAIEVLYPLGCRLMSLDGC